MLLKMNNHRRPKTTPTNRQRDFLDFSNDTTLSSTSNFSLPSLASVSLPSKKDCFDTTDFAGSIPISSDSTVSLFGNSIPKFQRYNIFKNIRKEKKPLEEGYYYEYYTDANGKRRKRKKKKEEESNQDNQTSMLGEDYKYDARKNVVYVKPAKGLALPSSKKMSKHSTTTRKLKPEKTAESTTNACKITLKDSPKKKPKEFTKVPGPLPRVFQRAKLTRQISDVVASMKEEKTPKKQKPSWKKASSGVMDALRREAEERATYWDKYFGDSARFDFYEKYKEAGKRYISQQGNVSEDDMTSPRTKYMNKVIQDGLLPLPLLLRKEKEPKGIFLGHKGVGDANMLPVIHVLENLPTVETIDFSDNRLTDESLMPLALKLTKLQNLTSLNLSDNKIDDSSQVIMDYLRNKDCKLKSLYLDAADVDDNECCNLAQAILENESIEILSLRNNLIGKDELLNVVNPDLETGGEALGEMLCHNQTITELDVSWNFIRLDSACQLADSLLLNNTLVTLKLAYNAFGDLPTQYLGKALKENRTMKYIDMSYNSITPRSATVLANALIHNDVLETLILDGNTLGEVGAQAVVGAVQRSSNERRNLNVSFFNCDCKMLCPDVFNATNPSGTHTLDLSEPYGQMVCEEIIYLANYRAGCVLNSIKYRPVGSSTFKTITLQRPVPETAKFQRKCIATQKEFAKLLLDIVENRIKKYLPEVKEESANNEDDLAQKGSSRSLKTKRSAVKIPVIVRRRSGQISESDSDDEDTPDHDEVMRLKAAELCKTILEQFDLFPDDSLHLSIVDEMLLQIEKKMNETQRRSQYKEDFIFSALYHLFFAIFELNDTDKSGDMDLEEFLNCILCLGVEFERKYAKKLIRDFDVDKSGFIDNQEFAMIMVNEFCRLDVSRDELCDVSTKKPWVIPTSGTVIMDVHYQCELPSIYDVSHDEGIMGVIKSIREVPEEEQREIIFQNATTSPYFFMSAQQALMLFEEMGKHNESRLDVLARVLPQLVSPEQCNRFIDSVLNANDKFALRVKMGQSYNVFMGLYSGHYTFDLKHSQKRQEGRALSAVWAEEMMYMRKHKCDTSQRGNYSNFRNETYGGIPTVITSNWFAGCPTSGKLRLDYISTVKPKSGCWPLSTKRFNSLKNMLGLENIMGVYKNFEMQKKQSKRSSADGTSFIFPSSLSEQNKDSSEPLPSNRKNNRKRNVDQSNVGLTRIMLEAQSAAEEIDSMLSLGAIKEFFLGYMETSHHYHSIYPEERQRDVSRSDYDPTARPVTPEILRDTDEKPSLTKYDKIFPYAYMKLLKLQLALPAMYLCIDQVIDIIQMFPPVNYLRVQAFVSMFSRIVDYDKNGVRILDILSRDDQSELLHRVGILNVMDPMSPDRLYRLDLRRWDHREACKIMIQLAIVEPGDNWLGEEYRWSKYDANVPGWTLPMQWTSSDESHYGDGGPRRHGWCSFTYTTTGPGCAPSWNIRREMRKRVLCGIKRNT